MKDPLRNWLRNRFGGKSERSYETDFDPSMEITGPNNATEVPYLSPPDAILRRQLYKLRAKSRQEFQRNDLARSVLLSMRHNVIGEGIQLCSRHENVEVRNALETAWKQWGMTCGFNDACWLDIERQVLHSLIVDGEAFVEMTMRGGQLAIKVRDAQTCDPRLNEVFGRGEVRLGIARDDMGEPVEYLFRNPNFVVGAFGYESYQIGSIRDTERIPASRMIHVYDRSEVATTRGVPWIASSQLSLELQRHYIDSENVAARRSAELIGIVKDPRSDNALQGDELKAYRKNAKSIKPGSIWYAPTGHDAELADAKHPTTAFEAFVNTNENRISAGVGLASFTVNGALDGINFSAGRLGAMAERLTFKEIRRMITNSLHKRVFDVWLPMYYPMLGVDAMPQELMAVDWKGQAWDHVQPREQAMADQINVANKLKSRTQIIRDRGDDPETVFAELEEEEQRFGMGEVEPMDAPETDEDGNNMPRHLRVV